MKVIQRAIERWFYHDNMILLIFIQAVYIFTINCMYKLLLKIILANINQVIIETFFENIIIYSKTKLIPQPVVGCHESCLWLLIF